MIVVKENMQPQWMVIPCFSCLRDTDACSGAVGEAGILPVKCSWWLSFADVVTLLIHVLAKRLV